MLHADINAIAANLKKCFPLLNIVFTLTVLLKANFAIG